MQHRSSKKQCCPVGKGSMLNGVQRETKEETNPSVWKGTCKECFFFSGQKKKNILGSSQSVFCASIFGHAILAKAQSCAPIMQMNMEYQGRLISTSFCWEINRLLC